MRLETTGPWPSAFVRAGDDWVSLHSRRDPVAEAERQLAQQFPDGLPTTIAVVGLGLGFLLDALDRRGFAGRVAAAEPVPALVDALRGRAVAQAWIEGERLSLLMAPGFEGSADLWKAFGEPITDPRVLVPPVLARACPAESEAARTVLERAAFAARANADAKRDNAGRYLLNMLRNARAIAAGGDVATLVGLTPGVPAVVVAAGPSLDRNLADIAAYRDRALVIAVDTALRPLLTAGIHPDIVVGVDPTEANARHLTDLPPCPETHLVAEGSLDPEALRHFEGRTFFFRVSDHHPWPWLREQGCDRGRLRAFGSVLTTAFDLALVMGCDPIVFAGADLAFTDGRPYARGTTYEDDWRREQAWGATLEEIWRAQLGQWPEVDEVGVRGATHRTAPHLRAFRDWIVTEARQASARTIVNGTEAGILVGERVRQGTIALALRDRPSLSDEVRARTREAHRSAGTTARVDVFQITSDTRSTWLHFAGDGTPAAAIDEALGQRCGSTVADGASAVSVAAAVAPHDRVLEAFTARADAAGTLTELPRTADLARVSEYAARALPSRVIGIGDGAAIAGLTAILAAGAHATLQIASPDAAAQAIADGLGVGTRVRITGDSPGPAPLVILTCDHPAGNLEQAIAGAWTSVEHGGRLIVFDSTRSPGGVPVRRALYRFLESHPQVAMHHRRYFDPDAQVSWLADRDRMRSEGFDLDKGSPAHPEVADRLAGLIVERYNPSTVLDVGCGRGYWLDAFRRLGVNRVTGVEDSDWLAHVGMAPVDPAVSPCDLASLAVDPADLCLCVNVVHRVPHATASSIIAACTASSDMVVFASPAPGIGLPGFINERPWSVWHRLFLERGFVLHDELRPVVEARWGGYRSTHDLLVVYRRDMEPGPVDGDSVRQALLESASRIDDLMIQGFWYQQRLAAIARASAASASAIPVTPMRSLVIAPAAMRAAEPGARRYVFRTDAARIAVGVATGVQWAAREDHVVLRQVQPGEGRPLPPGSFSIDRDGVTFRASDGSDPRLNGREYTLHAPSHVVWCEQQAFDTVVQEGL